jgi:hypothetical protein
MFASGKSLSLTAIRCRLPLDSRRPHQIIKRVAVLCSRCTPGSPLLANSREKAVNFAFVEGLSRIQSDNGKASAGWRIFATARPSIFQPNPSVREKCALSQCRGRSDILAGPAKLDLVFWRNLNSIPPVSRHFSVSGSNRKHAEKNRKIGRACRLASDYCCACRC